MGLLVFGIIFIVIAIVARFTTLWNKKETSQCVENDNKIIKENKVNFYVILSIGIILTIIGICLL